MGAGADQGDDDTTILVEAKASGSERAIREHWDIDEPLRERFEGPNLPSVPSFEFVDTPPPLHRLEEVWSKALEAVMQTESERASGASHHAEVRIQIGASAYLFRFSLLASPQGDDSGEGGRVIYLSLNVR